MRTSWFAAVLVLVIGPARPALAQTPTADPAPAVREEPESALSEAASLASKPTFGSLFANVGHDLKQLPSKQNAITLAIGGVLALAAHPGDRALTSHVITSERLDEVFDAGAASGSGWMQIGGAFGTYLLGRGFGSQAAESVGASLVRAQILNGIVTEGIKLAVRRTRPDQGHFSFPSGHASATFATATVLEREFGWKVGLPAYGLAAYVAGSRVQGNRHYASDVIFGAAVGIVAGRTVSVGHGAGRFEVAPLAVPGGGGIAFTRTH